MHRGGGRRKGCRKGGNMKHHLPWPPWLQDRGGEYHCGNDSTSHNQTPPSVQRGEVAGPGVGGRVSLLTARDMHPASSPLGHL